MTDIEKINLESALRIADSWLSEFMHYEAPYFGSGEMEEIKKALEKQIPKKPKTELFYGGRCIVCDSLIPNQTVNYCHNCGQKLDWSE